MLSYQWTAVEFMSEPITWGSWGARCLPVMLITNTMTGRVWAVHVPSIVLPSISKMLHDSAV